MRHIVAGFWEGLAAAGVLLIAWGVTGLLRIWWQKRELRRACGAVYLRTSEPLIRGQLVVRNDDGTVRAARSFVQTDWSATRNNPTADGGTEESP